MKKEPAEVFKEVLVELGFSNHKPDQMTNSDYWLCTCTAMERYAQLQIGELLNYTNERISILDEKGNNVIIMLTDGLAITGALCAFKDIKIVIEEKLKSNLNN